MYLFLIVVHVFVCLVLISVILLQAGRGGGLADVFGGGGGGAAEKLLGTQSNVFMTRATEVCAVVFVITSLTLGILSSHRGKSLLEKQRLLDAVKRSAPAIPKPVEETKNEIAQAAAPASDTVETAAEGNATS